MTKAVRNCNGYLGKCTVSETSASVHSECRLYTHSNTLYGWKKVSSTKWLTLFVPSSSSSSSPRLFLLSHCAWRACVNVNIPFTCMTLMKTAHYCAGQLNTHWILVKRGTFILGFFLFFSSPCFIFICTTILSCEQVNATKNATHKLLCTMDATAHLRQ